MIEPRANNSQIDPIILILVYIATPNVAAKKHNAEVIIDGTVNFRVVSIACFLSLLWGQRKLYNKNSSD